jgi:pimeloyl-ACP methyl ester carboxylesterase
MANTKPTLVFVHGAWHDAKCFGSFLPLLTAHGYECKAVSLPSVGCELRGEEPIQNWDPDVEVIRLAILALLEAGKDVVLVVHSYGGTVGSEAVKGLEVSTPTRRGKVVRLVYLAAMALQLGGWIWEATGGRPIEPDRTILKVAQVWWQPIPLQCSHFNSGRPVLCP